MTVVSSTVLGETLTYAVLAGKTIPAHDELFDLAEAIAEKLSAFHTYVAMVRDNAQADAALTELVDAIKSGTGDLTRQKVVEIWKEPS